MNPKEFRLDSPFYLNYFYQKITKNDIIDKMNLEII